MTRTEAMLLVLVFIGTSTLLLLGLGISAVVADRTGIKPLPVPAPRGVVDQEPQTPVR